MTPEMPLCRALQVRPTFRYGSARDDLDFPIKAASRKGVSKPRHLVAAVCLGLILRTSMHSSATSAESV